MTDQLSRRLKIAVLASHGGSNMQAIMDAIVEGRLRGEIVLVISNNSASGAVERARRFGAPTLHLSSQTHPGEAERDIAMRDALMAAGTEVVVLAGYMRAIGSLTLIAFAGRMLNIHPALLPRHGGRGMYGIHPHEAVLAAGETESGATVHLVTPQYDQGPVLKQERVAVEPGDSPQSLQQRVLAVEHRIYPAVLIEIAEGRLKLPIAAAEEMPWT